MICSYCVFASDLRVFGSSYVEQETLMMSCTMMVDCALCKFTETLPPVGSIGYHFSRH